MQGFLVRFAVRWLGSALGLWIAAAILGVDRLSAGGSLATVAGAGFFLALVNMFLKPLLVLLSFPAIILSLGLFMLVVNGFLIIVAGWLSASLYVGNFWDAVVAGIIVSIVNLLITIVVKDAGGN